MAGEAAVVKPIVFTKKGDNIVTAVLIKDYSVRLTKNGAEYIEGTLQAGKAFSFKAWGNSEAFKALKAYDFKGQPSIINGDFDDYNGVQSIVLATVSASDAYKPEDFLEVKYDKKLYAEALLAIVERSCSPKGVQLIKKMLFDNTEVFERFCAEFAAKSHHDNCLSGLLAHTYKLTALLEWVLSVYSTLIINESKTGIDTDRKDLFIIGAILHDVGKVIELEYGSYTEQSVVPHNVLGMDFLYQFRSDIEEAYGTLWFRNLQSVLSQHHGEWGDPCRSIFSYVIYKVDVLDAKLTEIGMRLMDADLTTPTSIKIDDFYLQY